MIPRYLQIATIRCTPALSASKGYTLHARLGYAPPDVYRSAGPRTRDAFASPATARHVDFRSNLLSFTAMVTEIGFDTVFAETSRPGCGNVKKTKGLWNFLKIFKKIFLNN
jgi:hypothetical protein